MLDAFTFPSALGELTAFADHGKLVGLTHAVDEVWAKKKFPQPMQKVTSADEQLLFEQLQQQVNTYTAGTLDQFNLPLAAEGTPFQKQVWQALREIPYGETVSYTTLAQRIGKPKAVRAVGSACGANPIPLIIPCHRAISQNGTLGGFRWGLDVKRQLLSLEQTRRRKLA